MSYFKKEDVIIFVAVVIALTQGLNSIVDLPLSYMYKDDYQLKPAQAASLIGFIIVPWLLKPIWGVLSDNYPIFGYKRKSYAFLLGLLGFAGYLGLGLWSESISSGICLLLMISLSFAFQNVIGEALLVESAQRYGSLPGKTEEDKQKQASKNVSLFFAFKNFGTIITAYTGGLLLAHIHKRTIFLMASSLPLGAGLVALFLPENKHSPTSEESHSKSPLPDEETTDLIQGQRSSTIKPSHNSTVEKVVDFLRQPEIYKPLIFLFFFRITPSASSAMFYFYTNELKFSPEFMGELKLAGSVAILIGIFIYNRFLTTTPIKKILMWSSVICVLLGLSQILLISRANLEWGIPDKIFCIGDSLVIVVFAEIHSLPILILTCRLCPKNIEGTMYALFMSIFNFGNILSTQLGALLMWILGITEESFQNLWILIVISAVCVALPLPWLQGVQFDEAVKKTRADSQQSSPAKQSKSDLDDVNGDDDDGLTLDKSHQKQD